MRLLRIRLTFLSLFLTAAACVPAWAFDSFVIKDIRVEGLQRTEAGTIFSYLPVKVGERFTDEKAAESIKALFATGFFKDVRIEIEGDVLVVAVDERPAIATVDLTGTKALDKDAIKKSLKETGMAEGRIFDRALLDKTEQEMKRQYLSQGLYGMTVKTTVTPLERNRVGIMIDVNEGEIARIKKINLVGVHAFKESELLEQLSLASSGWLSWYSKDDQYSKQKLTADLETLRSFYFNRGYLEFNLESTQVSITPDKKDIYITATIREGQKFTVSEVRMGGNTILPAGDLLKLVELKSGDVFNGEKLSSSTKKIQERLGNEGYAFANANAAPEIDRTKQTVAFTILVDPGRRVYVRRVNVSGNTRTRDEVVRRELHQIEGAYYDGEKISTSKKRLDRLGYFAETTVETPAVSGTPDQVDVNIRVTEKPTGQLLLGAGFSSAEKVVLQTSISQANVFGSGNTIGASISTSKSNKSYSLSQTNPYFTVDGISRSYSIYHRDFNAGSLNLGDYKTTSTGASIAFGYPLTSIDTLVFSLSPDVTSYSIGAAPPLTIANYVNTYGRSITSLPVGANWFRDTRDSATFTRAGPQKSACLAARFSTGASIMWNGTFSH
jgi:outer membrane protein insertion porin family